MNAEQELIYSKRASQIVNVLKGIAIWMVVFQHFEQTISSGSLHPLFNAFQLGCQIFFTLSAFTLCLSFNKTPLSYWQYFKKRVLKLFLAWYVMIILGIIWKYLNHNTLKVINFKAIIVNALFLNGLDPNSFNSVVRGGWFIGTLFILYLLFPLLYKVFNFKNEKWQKCRHIVFPACIITVSSIIILALKVLFRDFGAYRFFVYTNFINQICAFAIGFSLFHLYQTTKIKRVKLPLLKAILFAIISVGLFIVVPQSQFIVVIVTVALTTLYAFCFMFNNEFIKNNIDSELIMKFFANTGKISLGIYYTHSYLVWDGASLLIKEINKISTNQNFFIPFAITLVILTLCYWVGKAFYLLINLIQKPLLNAFNL